jgi:hypothetical protein
MIDRSLQFYWVNREIDRSFQSGVSIHSHTSCSKENLGFIRGTSRKVPGLKQAVMAQERKYYSYYGKELDYKRGYWTPPLPPVEALTLERRQIRDKVGLPGLVSITDHDTMEACHKLEVVEGMGRVPFSVEWTVPRQQTFFHIGVHNVPAADAARWMADLAEFSARPNESRLAELLEALHGIPEVLIVFNHPLWDEKDLGHGIHRAEAMEFLDQYGEYVHALELNGFRPWRENLEVIELARQRGYVTVSGGDRHGTEPNANVNLSRATTFEGFVEEIRRDRQSHVLFLPQYNQAKPLRVMHMLLDIFRVIENSTSGQPLWVDRVFFINDEGEHRPLASYWTEGQPGVVKLFVDSVMMLENRHVLSAVRFALRRQEVAL